MQKAIEIVEERVKELELVVSLTPINKSFAAQARLDEARAILVRLHLEYQLTGE